MVVAEAKTCAEGVDGIEVHLAVLLLEIHAVAVLVRIEQLAVAVYAGFVIDRNDLADSCVEGIVHGFCVVLVQSLIVPLHLSEADASLVVKTCVQILAGKEADTEVLVRSIAMRSVVEVAVIACLAVFQERNDQGLAVLLVEDRDAPTLMPQPLLSTYEPVS